MSELDDQHMSVLEKIDKEELADLALKMGNIHSPHGYEGEAGEYVADWFRDNGFETLKQEVVPERYNAIGILRGNGRGKSLIYNAHLDTSQGTIEDRWDTEDPKLHYLKAWREGDTLFGQSILNAKGPIAGFMLAGKAIKESGIVLKGDLILAPTCGEIGQAPIDEFQGPRYLGKGIGVEHLVRHGFVADYALICETTSFTMGWAQPGDSFFKITVKGHYTYTPYVNRPYKLEENPNAIVKMAKVILALEEWAYDYQVKNTTEYPGGTIIPKVSLGAIRGGNPTKPLGVSGLCSLYIDVRIPPARTALEIKREIEDTLASTGIETRVEPYLARGGFIAKNVEGLLESINKSHVKMFGEPPVKANWSISSMWRDMNIFNAHGIPSATYGPGIGAGSGNSALKVDDLFMASKLYALIALDICNQDRNE
jgi:acetylornithine deacetylase/succinyl-diaminopimelate desuccinylase-like protein